MIAHSCLRLYVQCTYIHVQGFSGWLTVELGIQFHTCALLPVNFEFTHTLHDVYKYKIAQNFTHAWKNRKTTGQPIYAVSTVPAPV